MGGSRSTTWRGFAAGLLLGAAGGLLLALAIRPARPTALPDTGRAGTRETSSDAARMETSEHRSEPHGDAGTRVGTPSTPAPPAATRGTPATPAAATGTSVLDALRRAEVAGGTGAFQPVFARAVALRDRTRGAVSRETVRRLLAHERPVVRRAGLLLAPLLPDPPSVVIAAIAHGDSDPMVRSQALEILADLARPGGPLPVETAAAELLRAIREEPDVDVRESAAKGLPGLTPAAADVAVRLIREDVVDGFVAGEMVLGLVVAGRAAPLLEGDPPRWLVDETAACFASVFGKGGAEMLPLARTLAPRYEDLARGAGQETLSRFLRALRRLGETAVLERMARDDRLSVRVRGECLGELTNGDSRPRALETARGLLAEDPVAGMRLVAVRILESVHDEELRRGGDATRRALETAARDDPSPWVREAAANRLANLGD